MIIFNDFSKKLLNFLLRWVIQSRELQRKHVYKSGDLVLYYDGIFSNIHEIDLKENEGLTNEVLWNTLCYNENREWDLLTGIYIWLPKENKVFAKILKEVKVMDVKGMNTEKAIEFMTMILKYMGNGSEKNAVLGVIALLQEGEIDKEELIKYRLIWDKLDNGKYVITHFNKEGYLLESITPQEFKQKHFPKEVKSNGR